MSFRRPACWTSSMILVFGSFAFADLHFRMRLGRGIDHVLYHCITTASGFLLGELLVRRILNPHLGAPLARLKGEHIMSRNRGKPKLKLRDLSRLPPTKEERDALVKAQKRIRSSRAKTLKSRRMTIIQNPHIKGLMDLLAPLLPKGTPRFDLLSLLSGHTSDPKAPIPGVLTDEPFETPSKNGDNKGK